MTLTNKEARTLIIAVMDNEDGVTGEVYDIILDMMHKSKNMDIRPYLKSINGRFYLDIEAWNEDIEKDLVKE